MKKNLFFLTLLFSLLLISCEKEETIVVTKDGRWRISDIIMVKSIDVEKDKDDEAEKDE